MSRSKGRRYSDNKKLNVKKVIAVIIAFLVIIMFIVGICEILKQKPKTNEKVFPLAYFTINENGKWGVMDTKSNIVIEPTYENMIIIPDNTKPVFICMENVDYNNETYTSKAVDKNNEKLFTNYDQVEVIYNNDENNNLFYANVLKVQKDGKYGLISMEGQELLACSKDAIDPIIGTEDVFVTTENDKKGLVDKSGKTIIENNYEEITALTSEYENGFIVKNEEGKYGVINYDTTVALEEKYDEVKNIYGNNMYVVKEGKDLKIVNQKNEEFLTNKFDDVKAINTNDIIVKVNGKYGVFNINGEEKIPTEYENLQYTYSDNYIAKKDSKYGIIDINNEEKLAFNYKYIKYLDTIGFFEAQTEGVEAQLLDKDFQVKVSGMVVEINTDKNYIRMRKDGEYKYYNFKLEEEPNTEILGNNTIFLSKRDGKYGYVNEKGVVVVDYKYDDATEQNKYGYVAVKKDGKWGSLNSKGNVVSECNYELENSLIIDFIGNWHLSTDINANYYTK